MIVVGLLGKERKAMTGRGTFRKQKHTMKAQGGCQLNATNEARELRKTAEAYATQARRLGHTADRAKRIGAISISENLKEELITQNNLTLHAIFKNFVDKTDTEEEALQERISQVSMMEGEQPAAVSCTYSRGQKWYNEKAAEVRSRAQQAFVKITKDKMEDNVKGIKVMSCALNTKPSKPLMHAKRDRVGPAGQKIGTITMDPCEVDGIATRAWKAIYNCNCSDLQQSVSYFKET